MQRRHRVEQVRHEARAGVDGIAGDLRRCARVPQRDRDVARAQRHDQVPRAGQLRSKRDKPDRRRGVVRGYPVRRRAQPSGRVHPGVLSAEKRAFEMDPRHRRGRVGGALRQFGRDPFGDRVVRRDDRRQVAGHAMLKLDRVDRIERRGSGRHLVAAGAVDLQVEQPGRHDSVAALVRRAWRRAHAGGGDELPIDFEPPVRERSAARQPPGQHQAHKVTSGGSRIAAIASRRSRRIAGRFRSSCNSMRGQRPAAVNLNERRSPRARYGAKK